MKYIFSICIFFTILSCRSSENQDRRSITSSNQVVSFEGEYPDKFTQIMFTCDRFGIKSKLAASYFNQKAIEKNLNYRATAKSLNMTASTSKLIPTRIINEYRKKGLNIKNPAIVGFRPKDINKVESIYMMDAFTSYGENEKFIDWTDVEGGPYNKDFGLEGIKTKIDELMLNF